MARDRDKRPDSSEEIGGSLADAISAHLALKREHGADVGEVERERREALAPARRDVDDSADLRPAPAEAVAPAPASAAPPAPAPEPEPAPAPEVVTEPAPVTEPVTEPEVVAEPEPAPAPEPTLEPAPEPEPTPAPTPAGYREDTGTIEFEWGGEESPPEPEETEPTTTASDVLEATPEFFEETPEYDKLWFEERPPREFDF